MGRRSKLGGTRRNSGEENTGGKDFMERKYYLEGKDHTERLIGKTIQPIYYYVK